MRTTALLSVLCKTQIGGDWHFEEVAAQEPGRKEQDLEVLDLACDRVNPCDHTITQFFGLLLFVRRLGIDVEDVALAVVPGM
jgi:hypothetical protein